MKRRTPWLRWPHFQKADWLFVIGVLTLAHFLLFTNQDHPEVLFFILGCFGVPFMERNGNGNEKPDDK